MYKETLMKRAYINESIFQTSTVHAIAKNVYCLVGKTD